MKQKISIRPSTIQDRKKVFQWLTQSNVTSEMMGEPNYPDHPIPNWEDFICDYDKHYFDGSKPMEGRCFIIQLRNTDIGQINYNVIDTTNKVTDIDIWMCDKKYTGKGYGMEAIKLLCNYLKNEFSCKKIEISPSKRNVKAIKAYQKAGFKIIDQSPISTSREYIDNIIMERPL